MKIYIGLIACFLIICTSLTGCGLVLINGPVFDPTTKAEPVESVKFVGAELEKTESENEVATEKPERQTDEGDNEGGRGEQHDYVAVDSGFTVIEVTDQNIYQANNKYGINTMGVIIIDSKYSNEFKCGDKITHINEAEIGSADDMDSILKGCKVGEVITVRIERGSKTVDIKLTLEEKPQGSVDFG
jgi:S1-C subfamily serine protease